MREWLVAGAVVESDEGLLLVRNRRRGGRVDWTPPGGVIDVHAGESLLDGLRREVEEETGLLVTAWGELLYSVTAEAPELGWRMRCEVHRAAAWDGVLRVEDPDGIVDAARFVDAGGCRDLLGDGHPWVVEPLVAWLCDRWEGTRPFGYRLDGTEPDTWVVTRIA